MTTTPTTPEAIAALPKYDPAAYDDRAKPLLVFQAGNRDAEDWHYDDVIPVISNILIERDALAARLAEVEAEVIEGEKQIDAMLGRCNRAETDLAETEALEMQHGAVIDRLIAERDTALAQLAVSLDRAKQIVMERHIAHMTAKGRNPANYISDWSMTAKAIRALTPADATAALTAMLDKARGETIEAAKTVIDAHDSSQCDCRPYHGHEDRDIALEWASDAIDALHTPATRAAKGGA